MKITVRLLKNSQFRLGQKVEAALRPDLLSWKAASEAWIEEQRHQHQQWVHDHIELLEADDELAFARSVRLI